MDIKKHNKLVKQRKYRLNKLLKKINERAPYETT